MTRFHICTHTMAHCMHLGMQGATLQGDTTSHHHIHTHSAQYKVNYKRGFEPAAACKIHSPPHTCW